MSKLAFLDSDIFFDCLEKPDEKNTRRGIDNIVALAAIQLTIIAAGGP